MDPAVERVRAAYLRRHETDYVFAFWSALGWILLTCGIYLVYVVYQMVRRARDHNARRIELLDAATTVAWERAHAQGRAEELRPHFERIAAEMVPLRQLTTEFREPAIWVVLAIFAPGIVELIVLVLLDQDLVQHDYHEGAVENELAFVYTSLGTPMGAPDPARLHQPYAYAGRVVASVVTCGIYTFFWLNDSFRDGNDHFRANWVWEDGLAGAVQAGAVAA